MIKVVAGSIAFCALAWLAPCVLANPNHQVVDVPFAVHGAEFSAELHKRATETYELAKRKLFDYLEKEAKGDLQKIQANDLGQTHVLVTRLRRAGVQLQLLGEPAGADFERRADAMGSHLGRLVGEMKTFPATQKFIEVVRQAIARGSQTRAKAIVDLQERIQRKQWEQAETDLHRLYDQLEVGTIYLTPPENQSIYQPFSQVDSTIHQAMDELRSTKAKQLLQMAHKEALPHFSSVITAMNMAIEGLESKDTGVWKTEELTAPQLVVKFAEAWREAQVGALKAQGKEWALRARRNGSSMSDPAAIAGTGAATENKFATEYNAFSSQVMTCITRLIDAETARKTSDDVTGKYTEFLRVLAPVVRETNNAEFSDTLNQSLAKLRAKTPALDEQAKAYEAATSELLRWRARVAAARASVHAVEFQSIEQRLIDGTMSKEEYTGLFTEGAGGARSPQLMSPAPDVMKVAVTRLMGQKAMARDVVRLPGEGKSSIARYAARTYVAVAAPLPLESEVHALEQDLFAGPETPPLSLKGMQAVLTAQRGDMATLGGDISGLYLEAVITRYAGMPTTDSAKVASAATMTVLGQLPVERGEAPGLSDVLMRFAMTPRWVQHDYFFVQLAPPVATTASVR
jgi:hypothetical protein